MNASVQLRCDVCGSVSVGGMTPWHYICGGCGLEWSTLKPAIGDVGLEHRIDEQKREDALHPIRERNFDTILRWISARIGKKEGNQKPRLLDVGCAHGWFAAKASDRFQVVGIEPDRFIADQARSRCAEVRDGYFPDAVKDDERFEVIIFNDVLEHVPRVVEVLRNCKRHLATDGLIVVNAPDRRGALYRVAKMLAALGFTGSFQRMWQFAMPSPHLYYFDSSSMMSAATAAGLSVQGEQRLPAIMVKGLYARIRFDRDTSHLAAAVFYIGVLILTPLLRLLPPDINVWILKADDPTDFSTKPR